MWYTHDQSQVGTDVYISYMVGQMSMVPISTSVSLAPHIVSWVVSSISSLRRES